MIFPLAGSIQTKREKISFRFKTTVSTGLYIEKFYIDLNIKTLLYGCSIFNISYIFGMETSSFILWIRKKMLSVESNSTLWFGYLSS